MPAFSLHDNKRTRWLAAVAVGATAALVLSSTVPGSHGRTLPRAAKEFLADIQGVHDGGAGGETSEVKSALAQFNDARNAPGFAVAGGYTAAVDHIGTMSQAPGSGVWHEVTNVPYYSDDRRFTDYFANTTAGVGYVTGRVQALAAGGGNLYAAGAVGGVYRKSLSGGGWSLMSQGVPALSSGALAYDADGNLWYATGDGATGATTYTGDGVWVTSDPTAAVPTWTHLADGEYPVGTTRPNLFDGAVIQQLRFSKEGDWVYAPTSYGVWRHSTSDLSSPWQPVFVPVPSSLPGTTSTGSHSTDNYTTDVAIDPSDPDHVVVAYGWVAGGASNGWYDGHFAGGQWSFTKANVTGAIHLQDIGRTTFAWGQKKLYALVHDPDHAATGVSYSELGGVFVSSNGSIDGPWAKIADSYKLSQSGSALDPTVSGAGAVEGGYQPGVQAWYNQFLAVDPASDDHVFLGLEEVFETKNGGSNWSTPGPYWNFFFPCWGTDPGADQAGCQQTTHPDQHAVTISNGTLYVGNDGGVYSRPVDGTADSLGHATDWTSLSAPGQGTPDFLQYYAVGVGKVNPDKVSAINSFMGTHHYDPNGVIVSGGLQDVGGSILFSGDDQMGSNFGGDGGDVLVDPNDGCRIVQEYVDLTMRVTNVCAGTPASEGLTPFLDQSQANTRDIAPPETSARFTAPFAADHSNIRDWVAGGRHVWLNTKGFNIVSGSDWHPLVDLGLNASGTAVRTATAVASDGGDAIVAFCGSCNAGGEFESGYAFGRADAAALDDTSTDHGWTIVTTSSAVLHNTDGGTSSLPSRMIAGADVYHDSDGHVHYLLALNGFSRRWVEGPGAGVGHLFESTNGHDWYDWSNGSDAQHSLPDVPASTVKALPDGQVVLGTDLGVFIRDTTGDWYVLGSGLPASVVNDLEPGPGDGNLYAATYGRGIWKLAMSDLPAYAGGDSSQDTWWNANKPSGAPSATTTNGNGKQPARNS